jgi:hypothetical protein
VDKPEAGQLLQSTQRLRIYLSTLIYALSGYTGAVLLGIWFFLLKAYMDASRPPAGPLNPIDYLLIAAATSSLVLGVWRVSARRVDIRMAQLYPTFIYCEMIMGVPPNYGTLVYITDHVLEDFKKTLTRDHDQLFRGIEYLVNAKRIGTRGQGSIDLFAALLIAGQLFFSVYQFDKSPRATTLAVAVILLSLVLVAIGCFGGQRNPKQVHIDEAFSRTPPAIEKMLDDSSRGNARRRG